MKSKVSSAICQQFKIDIDEPVRFGQGFVSEIRISLWDNPEDIDDRLTLFVRCIGTPATSNGNPDKRSKGNDLLLSNHNSEEYRMIVKALEDVSDPRYDTLRRVAQRELSKWAKIDVEATTTE